MFTLPSYVEEALALLQKAGYEAYVVGGAVRDGVMHKEAHDWDITTSALPEETEKVFAAYRLIETGLKHGTVTVLINGEPLEITTYRVDGTYTDHRRPDSVHFTSSLTDDLARRDFTMNAMAYDPEGGLVDPFGGQTDLQNRVLRCVGEPERRFTEDGLRILRALRFASAMRLQLEEKTDRAVHSCKEELRQIAAERIRTELTRLLCGPDVERILLEYRDVLAVVMPQIRPMFDFAQHNPHHNRDVWAHTAAVVAAIPPEPVLRWAALWHDIGKPRTFFIGEDGIGHFYGHAHKSVLIAGDLLRRLRFDNASGSEILKLIRYHDLPLQADRKQIRRLISKLGADSVRRLIELHRADTCGQASFCRERLPEYDRVEQLLDEILSEPPCFTMKDLAINGHDVMALGLSGADIGKALQKCLKAVIDEKIPNEKEALLQYCKQQ